MWPLFVSPSKVSVAYVFVSFIKVGVASVSVSFTKVGVASFVIHSKERVASVCQSHRRRCGLYACHCQVQSVRLSVPVKRRTFR